MIVGIDQGTTGTLGILMDVEGRVIESAYRTHKQLHPRSGWVEHNPVEIWENVRDIAIELVRKALSLDHHVQGIGLANQGETVMAWDRSTSEPFANAIVWQDTRTQDWIDQLARGADISEYVAATTGLHLDSYFSAGKMRWLLEKEPAIREANNKDILCLGTLDTWLIWNFTRGGDFLTDASTAARTQLMNLKEQAFDPTLLELFNIARPSLPDIIPCDCQVEIRNVDPILDGIPIAASLVDQPAALFGHGCFHTGQSKATYGTGCFIYVNAGGTPPPAAKGLLSTLAWNRSQGASYALDGGVIAAASVVSWMKENLGWGEGPEQIDGRMVHHTPRETLTCVTAHAGLGSPIWDRSARAAWLGMDLSTTGDDLIYSALEGIAFRVAQVIEAMEKAPGIEIGTLRVDGGLSRCRTLMQLQADMLGRPVEVVTNTEATAHGIACFAARSIGYWTTDDEVARRVHVQQKFGPQRDDDWRKQRTSRLTEAQQLARGWGNQ